MPNEHQFQPLVLVHAYLELPKFQVTDLLQTLNIFVVEYSPGLLYFLFPFTLRITLCKSKGLAATLGHPNTKISTQ